MNDAHALIETEARQRINERVSRAAAPRLPRDPSRTGRRHGRASPTGSTTEDQTSARPPRRGASSP